MEVRTGETIGRRGPDSPAQVARGIFVDEGGRHRRALWALAGQLEQETVPRDKLLVAVDQVEQEWRLRPPDAEQQRALERLAQDRSLLSGSRADDLGGVVRELEEATRRRSDQLDNLTLGALSLALVGAGAFMGQILFGYHLAGPWQAACGATFLTGAIGAALAISSKERPPQLGQLGRLAVYGQVGASYQEVSQLADALGGRKATSVEVTDRGVNVGGVLLPRRKT